jgi:HEPN domain-containing protein
MNRKELQTLANMRIREARTLLKAKHFEGAYYLAGYSVECALKACIARSIGRFTFPDRQLAQEAYTHDLEKLLKLTGLHGKIGTAAHQVQVSWAVVKDWKETSRYNHAVIEAVARDMVDSCGGRKVGMLSWLKTHW